MNQRREQNEGWDAGVILMGTIYGVIVGAITALFTLPRSGITLRRSVEQTLESVRPRDSIADSLAEGKAAARRRHEQVIDELGG
jgi:gas vesicle protein